MDFENILERYEFTASEQSLIDFLIENPQQVASMSIRDMAKATYTSNATIIRFCKKLGFEGYKDFKIAFVVHLENQKHVNKEVNFDRPFYMAENSFRIAKSLADLTIESINLTQTSLDYHELDVIAKELYNAKRIFVFAIGDTNVTSMAFCNKLLKLNIYPIQATGLNETMTMAINSTNQDLGLFVSYRGRQPIFIDASKVLHKNGAKIITITANPKSELVQTSNHSIIFPKKEGSRTIGTFYSQICINYILTVLYSLIYNQNYAKHHTHKDRQDTYQEK